MKKINRKIALTAMLIFAAANIALAQITTFTYQGRLTDAGAPGTTIYQMKFELYADAGGTALIDTLDNISVTVTNSVFAAQLNFTHANAFNGNDRFLKISVRRSENESYVPLNPLQPITSAPYAIRAKEAANALAVGGTSAANIIKEGDSRLTDSRNPAAGSDNYIQNNPAAQQTANFNVSGNGVVGGKVGVGATAAPTTASLQVVGGVLARGGAPGANGASNNGFAFSGNSGDNDSGMFSIADGTLQLYTNNAERIRLAQGIDLTAGNGGNGDDGGAGAGIQLQAGNGGNGSSVPGGGRGGAGAGILLQAGNGGGGVNSGGGGAGAGITLQAGNGGSNSGASGNGGAGAGITLQGGNGGFGSAGSGNGGAGAGVLLQGGNGGGTAAGGAGGAGADITLQAGNGGNSGGAGGGGNGASITLQPGSGGSGYPNGTFGNVILAPTNGNVGIGTAAPTNKLHVVGNVMIGGTLSSSGLNISGSVTAGGTFSANTVNSQTQYNIGGQRVLKTDSSDNSFVGEGAGNNTTGASNSFFGRLAGASNAAGSDNSFFGKGAGGSNMAGGFNSFFGRGAGAANSSGGGNAFFGDSAGAGNQTGSNNTAVGANANVGSGALTFATAVGAGAIVSTVNTIALGRADGSDKVRVFGLGAAGNTQLCRNANNEISACSSSLRYKTDLAPFSSGLSFVNRLRPISYDWKAGGGRDVGFGAEDVANINPLFVNYNQAGEVEGVKYDRLSVVFVNAFKEQQTQIGAQKKQIERQQIGLERQQKQIDELKAIVCALQPAAAVCREEK